MKLTTTNGTLTLSGNTGLTFTIGTGTNDAATVQIEIDDQSSFGALIDTDTINITVNPVNDVPLFVTNDNNSLFAVQPAIDANGIVKLNPPPASPPIQQTTSEPTGSSVGTNINCIIKNEANQK